MLKTLRPAAVIAIAATLLLAFSVPASAQWRGGSPHWRGGGPQWHGGAPAWRGGGMVHRPVMMPQRRVMRPPVFQRTYYAQPRRSFVRRAIVPMIAGGLGYGLGRHYGGRPAYGGGGYDGGYAVSGGGGYGTRSAYGGSVRGTRTVMISRSISSGGSCGAVASCGTASSCGSSCGTPVGGRTDEGLRMHAAGSAPQGAHRCVQLVNGQPVSGKCW